VFDYVRPGDCLVGWKLDRLGRVLSPLFRIITIVQAQGVAFRSRTEQMDTTPQGAFLLRVCGALASYERALTQEHMRAGLEATRRRGTRGRTAPGDQRRKTGGHPRRLACGSQHSFPLPAVRG
jgi:DNA invertase Pin-like site-specific DNA recombinase